VTPGTHNPSISTQNVCNRLREARLRACRPVVRQVLTRHHRQQRHLWAQTHRCWTRQDWQKVLFTEELRFCLTRVDGRIRVYRRRNERYTETCTLERDRFGDGGSIMVWGGVSYHRTEHCRQSQRCALQGRHPPPSCGTLPAGRLILT
uniref:Transposase Tc1-like domain-containing protein n=1 Tax=Oncorhynchus tshawytscha TaxID=74940 RepID=A0AAZ3Q5W9_ONCTS